METKDRVSMNRNILQPEALAGQVIFVSNTWKVVASKDGQLRTRARLENNENFHSRSTENQRLQNSTTGKTGNLTLWTVA